MVSIISLLQMSVYIIVFFMFFIIGVYLFLINTHKNSNTPNKIIKEDKNNYNSSEDDDGPINNL